MTATLDLFARRFVQDGSQAVEEDVNYPGGIARLMMNHQLLGQLIASKATLADAPDPEWPAELTADATTPYAICLHPGRGAPVQGASNNVVNISPGTLLQVTGPLVVGTGEEGEGSLTYATDETILAYTFKGTESVTIANGDTTHYRVDIIEMQLSLVETDTQSVTYDNATPPAVSLISQSLSTTKRVQCTLAYKQGVAASSPTYPDPDSGYCVIAGILVPPNYSGGSGLTYQDNVNVLVLHDQRMPLSVRGRRVVPAQYECRKRDCSTSTISAAEATPNSVSGPTFNGRPNRWIYGTTTNPLIYPIPTNPGDVIGGYTLAIDKSSASGSITAGLAKTVASSNSESTESAGSSYSGSAGYDLLTEGYPFTTSLGVGPAGTTECWYVWTAGGGTTGDFAYHVVIYWADAWVSDSSTSVGDPKEVLQPLAASIPCRVACPSGQVGRVVAVSVASKNFTSGGLFQATLGRRSWSQSGTPTINLDNGLDVSPCVNNGTVSNFADRICFVDGISTFGSWTGGSATHNPEEGVTINASATNGIGVPLWTSGLRAPFSAAESMGNVPSDVVLNLTPPSSSVFLGHTVFYVAEGL
jgi:hypothetical protein